MINASFIVNEYYVHPHAYIHFQADNFFSMAQQP